jgi:hypothetical protein
MAFKVLSLQIPPRLTLGMHSDDEDPGAGAARPSAVKCLKRNMPHRAEWRVSETFAFDGDLRITLKVVVKFLARMPMSIEFAVGRYFNKVNEYFAIWSEFFIQ